MWLPHEKEAIDVIREAGAELQVIFNKDAVMILPSGVNKMTGLAAALKEIGISKHNLVGVGDAENDHAFLDYCECAIGVANAIPALKEHVDLVTAKPRGEGVVELVEKLLADDLAGAESRLGRHDVALGKSADGTAMTLSPYGRVILVCGQSGSGKSTLVLGLMERAEDQGYQVCLIDPEGDYGDAECLTATGDASHPPSLDHLEKLLDNPGTQVAVNLVGVGMNDRPEMFNRVLAVVQERRTRTGRPHWLVVDEAHHMLPPDRSLSGGELAVGDAGSLVLITVHPGHVSPDLLKAVNTLIVTGKDPAETIREFCEKSGRAVPRGVPGDPEAGEVLLWHVDSGGAIAAVKTEPPRGEHRRHIRKYAQGELEEERVFYFRGPEGKLNLRAANPDHIPDYGARYRR